MASTPKPKPSRGSGGSFWITRQAIEALLANKATATQICAYLILARFTDESGQFSTAGMQAVYKGIGIGQDMAKRAVEALCKMHMPRIGKAKSGAMLVYPAETWAASKGQDLPHGPSEMSKVRWVMDTFMTEPDDRVWMANELVDGIGSFTQPMRRLKQSGDVAARILLLAYREQDLERFGGINPATMFYDKYDMEQIYRNLQGGYDLWHGGHEHGHVYRSCSMPTLGITEWPDDEEKKQDLINGWFRAMKALESRGFIYQVVSVLDREQHHPEAQVILELHAKTLHGYKPKGEGGLSGPTAKLSGLWDKPVTDSMGRFYGKYAAVVPAGMETHIIGIWRLRFRVSNPKNRGVRGAWARIHRSQQEAMDWLKDVAEQTGRSEEMGFEKPATEQAGTDEDWPNDAPDEPIDTVFH